MKKFTLEKNAQCLCGSGKRYRNCCWDILSNITKDMNFQREIDNKNFDKAFKLSLADLTRYMIYVKRDTEPMLLNNPILGEYTLEIDLKALGEIINKTLFVIKTGNLNVNFISMLHNLSNVFYNQKWHQLLTYYKAVWYYLYQNDIKNAAVILSGISYKEIYDVQFLQLYLDVKNDELSFSDKIEINDILIEKADNLTSEIQYMAAKGIEFFLIGDLEKAKELFNEAILLAEKNINHFKKTYDYFILAGLYNIAGKMFDNMGYIEKAVNYYTKILEDENVTQKGISNAYSRLGDAYFHLKNQEKALECYEKSVEIDGNAVSKIFIAHLFTVNEEFESASEILDSIDFNKLEDKEKIDFMFNYAELILHTKKKDGIENILIKLKELNVTSKYFNDKKNEFIINLQEVLHLSKDDDKDSGVKKVLRKINNYFILEPNIAGIGININQIFKDILK
ncbi:tetratricopeptide repeat protein [Peribacillus frigoritolerans]|uniref:tetratricopeptide repeat protein n=1 Tax=Peribacillus frigoritolerans TaxID=450367 RepID=UPI00227D9CB6|nr:tetratricopeptide repeat protein [Peribacillus frigoritolerans]MCY8935667.1 tetratricopeptide repeat protein [Peribacillus frigoritolerans]